MGCAANGDFVVAWESWEGALAGVPYEQDGDSFGVYAKSFSSDGNPTSGEFQVNSYTTGAQRLGDVSVAPDADFVPSWIGEPGGEFVIAWVGLEPSAYPFLSSGIRGQAFDSAGNKNGAEFEVNQLTTGEQRQAAIAIDDNGTFTVVWRNEYPTDEGVRARVFSLGEAPDCSSAPIGGCRTAGKSGLKVVDRTGDAKDSLSWKWSKGATTTAAEFGDPTAPGSTTEFTICVYDETASTPALVAELSVDRGDDLCGTKPCWKSVGSGRGYRFNDKLATSDGISKPQLSGKGGDKSMIKLSASGPNLALALPTPASGSKFFDQDTNVLIQLSTSDSAVCWESTLAAPASKNTLEQFADKF